MHDRPHRLSTDGLAYIVVTLICWSSVPLFLKHFSKFIDGWTANGWRYGMSGLFWLPLLMVMAWRGKLPRGLWRAALVPSICNISGQICFAWAPYFINPGLQTFLLRMQILFIAIGSYLLFPNERKLLRSSVYWLGIAVVFTGSVGIMMLNPQRSRSAEVLGVILALCGGAGFACYSLAVKHYMRNISPMYSFAAVSNYTALVLVILMLILGRGHGNEVFDFSKAEFGKLVASAMLGIALSHGLYYAAMNKLGVAVSTGVILLQPVIVSVGSLFLFDERLTAGQWACGLVAISGAAVTLYAQQRIQWQAEAKANAEYGAPVVPTEISLTAEPAIDGAAARS